MGALVAKALRPIKAFNIENRAHKIISKDKPDAAPKYPSTFEELKRVKEVDPNIDIKLDRKDPSLDDRLRNVYVTSHGRPEADVTKERRQESVDRPLPHQRGRVPDFDFGLKEPEKIPYGRTTLRQAIDYIGSHQVNPEEVTATKIAFEYKLKEDDVENILKYFKTFEVYLPATRTTAATFAGPTELRKKLYKVSVPQDGSIGAASLGARRDAPSGRRAPSVRSDERPFATQGDLLNSIKFQRRIRDCLITGKKVVEKNSIPPKEKPAVCRVNSKTSTGTKPGVGGGNDISGAKDKTQPSLTRGFHSPRPSSPKGRRSPHPSFF